MKVTAFFKQTNYKKIFTAGKYDSWKIRSKTIGRPEVFRKTLVTVTMRLRWSRGSVLAFGTQVRGFKPDRSRWIFQGEKILGTPSFGGEVKPSVPCRRFTSCKRSLNVPGSRAFSGKIQGPFLARVVHIWLLGSLEDD